jgi:hypothetical protein
MKFHHKINLPVVLGALSLCCPIIVVSIIALVHLSLAGFWAGVLSAPGDDANRHAAALMAIAEGFTSILVTFVGCVVGSLLGTISFLLQGRRRGVGFVGLVLNAAPLLFFALALIIFKL